MKGKFLSFLIIFIFIIMTTSCNYTTVLADEYLFVHYYEGITLTYKVNSHDATIKICDQNLEVDTFNVTLINKYKTRGDVDFIWADFTFKNITTNSVQTMSWLAQIQYGNEIYCLKTVYLFVPLKSNFSERHSTGEVAMDYGYYSPEEDKFYIEGGFYDTTYGWLINYDETFFDTTINITLTNVSGLNQSVVEETELPFQVIVPALMIITIFKRKQRTR